MNLSALLCFAFSFSPARIVLMCRGMCLSNLLQHIDVPPCVSACVLPCVCPCVPATTGVPQAHLSNKNKIGNAWLCQAWLKQNPTLIGPRGDYHVAHQSCASKLYRWMGGAQHAIQHTKPHPGQAHLSHVYSYRLIYRPHGMPNLNGLCPKPRSPVVICAAGFWLACVRSFIPVYIQILIVQALQHPAHHGHECWCLPADLLRVDPDHSRDGTVLRWPHLIGCLRSQQAGCLRHCIHGWQA